MGVKELGELLKALRKEKEANGERGVSLRDVEVETGIKNAYLSLIERGEIAQPSPQKLHKLAEYYGIPYERLMYEAGYLIDRPNQGKGVEMPMPAESYFMSANVNANEWNALAEFHRHFFRKDPDRKKEK